MAVKDGAGHLRLGRGAAGDASDRGEHQATEAATMKWVEKVTLESLEMPELLP